MPELPLDVITELLTWLPVKSLLRFRCVSKQWCALVDGQDFIKAHLNRSLISTHNSRLILGGMGTLHFLNLKFPENCTKMLDTPFKKPCFTWLWGSCNGLLLLKRDDNICLLNPSTKMFVNLPHCPVEYPDFDDDGDYSEQENYGLGYDCINDDYKVVRIVEFRDEENELVSSETRVYGLKSNSWRRISDFPCCLPENRPMWGAFIGGVLHMNVLNCELIVGFDLSSEDYHYVSLPECFDKKFGSLHVMVLGGCLCLLGGYIHHRTDVWVMKEYGVKESWTKLFSIAPPTVKTYVSVVPLVYSSDGCEVLLNHDNERLIWYDWERKTVREAPARNLPRNFYADVFVESLVPLRGFDVMKKQHVQDKRKGIKDNMKSDDFLSTGFKLKF